jgi:hypothetical protein
MSLWRVYLCVCVFPCLPVYTEYLCVGGWVCVCVSMCVLACACVYVCVCWIELCPTCGAGGRLLFCWATACCSLGRRQRQVMNAQKSPMHMLLRMCTSTSRGWSHHQGQSGRSRQALFLFLFFFFLQQWDLNSGPCACQAGATTWATLLAPLLLFKEAFNYPLEMISMQESTQNRLLHFFLIVFSRWKLPHITHHVQWMVLGIQDENLGPGCSQSTATAQCRLHSGLSVQVFGRVFP